MLIAIVMYPVSGWLEKKGLYRSVAVAVCLLVVGILLAALAGLMLWQLKVFQKESKALLLKINDTIGILAQRLNDNTGLSAGVWKSLETNAGSNFSSMLKMFWVKP
ncbi:MAG: hypothetical protein KF746_25340 [Chitinophagaceae bacterium]|nr:hypothetical protein [Chitinophagaceae bacterium]